MLVTGIAFSVENVNNIEREKTSSKTFSKADGTEETSEQNEHCIDIEQSTEPLNEFEQIDQFLYSTFPHLFPLGKGLR